jgi:hypothetical protein
VGQGGGNHPNLTPERTGGPARPPPAPGVCGQPASPQPRARGAQRLQGSTLHRRPRSAQKPSRDNGPPLPPSTSLFLELRQWAGTPRSCPTILAGPAPKRRCPLPEPITLTCGNMAALRQPHFREPRQRSSRQVRSATDAGSSPQARSGQYTSPSLALLPRHTSAWRSLPGGAVPRS